MTAVMDRIQKLHDMAESAKGVGNQEEAEAFAAKVLQMLDQHRLDSAFLEAIEDVEEVESMYVDGADFGYRNGQSKVSWFRTLVDGLCKVNGCRNIGAGGTRMLIIGVKSDREIVQYLASILIREMDRLLKVWKVEISDEGGVMPSRADCNGWRVGFARGIGERLARQRREFLDHNPNALLVINRHAVAVNDASKKIRTVTGRRTSISSQWGYNAGKSAAADANIHSGVNGGGAMRRLGA